MSQLVPIIADRAPALIAVSGERASYRFFEFFTANIRNPHTRRAYARAAKEFFAWAEAHGVAQLTAFGMRVDDVYAQNRRLWVRLHEKGGKQHAMPCHHNLEAYLHEYIDGAGLAQQPKAFLFQTYSRARGQLTGNPLPQANAYAMIQRRAKAAGIVTRVGNHTFRATGVTAYLKNGGTLERAAQMANHASTRTTQLYDRRAEEVTLDEVERVLI